MRRHIPRLLVLFVIAVIVVSDASAQKRRKNRHNKVEAPEISIYDVDTLVKQVPLNRRLWHDKIDKIQKLADLKDGIQNDTIYFVDDPKVTNAVTEAIIDDIDQMEVMIENLPADSLDAFKDNQMKITYLQILHEYVNKFVYDPRLDPYYYVRATRRLREMLIAAHENKLEAYVKSHIDIYTLDIVSMNDFQRLMPISSPARNQLFSEMAVQEPAMMIKRLKDFYDHPYACNVIKEAAKVVPKNVFNYASSTNARLLSAVNNCQDPLVQTIVKIANTSKSPLKAMPFLNDIYTGNKTVAQVDAITADDDLFYQNLVRLKLENVQLGGDTYTDELAYRGLKYVRDMNDLHEEKDPIRFKGIDGLSPEVLYFIMVYGQDEIYTSSFLGTFNRMIDRMGDMKGDELLDKVHHDKFRTFIRMCAGYNTLGKFLGTMSAEKKNEVMKRFVGGLDKGKDNDLEDAVDVADAFGSIKDSALADFLRDEIKMNYERSYKEKSKKGVIVYGLLASLFEKSKKNEYAQDAIRVTFNSLTNDSGVVYEQFFFYGDEDGKISFDSFLGNFRNNKWKIAKSQYWTKIESVTGKPIVIYANMPLKEPEDEEAQQKLCEHLEQQGIIPTIMVHRGHSYHLPLTLQRLQRETRVVMLGSCGGYHNLATVLDASPDANIISSKQTGAMRVNEPIIKAINDQMLEGKDIDWITTWSGLNTYFQDQPVKIKEMFDDYVPPHKNLGAIFIKEYRRLFNADLIN